ncbi:MAG TPA: preprotein translocase subunit SecE [Syntrophales bacterium]|jgi:preprotein translocase subunit SecE|nr:preprotein translocase subunit SecE [Syntrophales bacterium]
MDKVKQILSKIRQFLDEARAELKKVTWPTRKQTLASTAVVLVVSIFLSIFLGLVDFGLTKIIKVLLG